MEREKKQRSQSRVTRATAPGRLEKASVEKSEEILAYLKRLAPPVGRISVESPDPSKNMLILSLAKVCYMTSKTDSDREDETMFVTVDGERFYNSMSMDSIEDLLKEGNPWFLRTSKFYLVNLSKVTAWRFSSARDLWFQGLAEPVENAVSEKYLDDFNARFGI
jgi:DNA-binding LytR/AlgR family response regulator